MSGYIAVDLDGTLAECYWASAPNCHDGTEPYEPTKIGKPIPAMVERVKAWIAEGKEVRIFTARVAPGGSAPHTADSESFCEIFQAIVKWAEEHIGSTIYPTCIKDYEMTELWDDRAVTVEFNTGRILTQRPPITGCIECAKRRAEVLYRQHPNYDANAP